MLTQPHKTALGTTADWLLARRTMPLATSNNKKKNKHNNTEEWFMHVNTAKRHVLAAGGYHNTSVAHPIASKSRQRSLEVEAVVSEVTLVMLILGLRNLIVCLSQ